MSNLKLREVIKQIRQCKTAADERAVISKESALIRNAFKVRISSKFSFLIDLALHMPAVDIQNCLTYDKFSFRKKIASIETAILQNYYSSIYLVIPLILGK